MKKLLTLALLLATATFAQAEEISFVQGSWHEVLTQAQTQHKLVFVDAYTTWCGPCKWMAANVFTNPEVAAFFNANFVNAQVDMEKGEGPELAKRYEVSAYPTLLWVDGTGKLTCSSVGARQAEELLQLAQDVLAGKVVNLSDLTAQFDAGNHDRAFLKTYMMELARAQKSVEAPLAIYKEGMKGAALLEQDNWEIFNYFFGRHDSEIARYFYAHIADFEAKYGHVAVQNKGRSLYNAALYDAIDKHDHAAYARLRVDLAHSTIDSVPLFLRLGDANWYAGIQDWRHLKKALQQVDALGWVMDAFFYNNAAWAVYETQGSKRELKLALQWVDRSLAIEDNYLTWDTKAHVLHALGRKAEAIAAGEKSVAMGNAEGDPNLETQQWLDQIR